MAMYEHEFDNLQLDYKAPIIPIEVLCYGYIVAAVLSIIGFYTI